MNKLIIEFRGKKYQTYKTFQELQELCDMGFDPRRVYAVKMENKADGTLRSMDWGHQSSAESAIHEATAHMGRTYKILYAQPIMVPFKGA